MTHARFSGLIDDVVTAYEDARQQRQTEGKLHAAIRGIEQRYHDDLGQDFHHVLTEIALLQTRVDYERQSSTIVFQLNGRHQQGFPDYITPGNDYLRTVLGHGNGGDGSKYNCFLEMLEKLSKHERLQTGSSDLIRKMRDIYDDAVQRLNQNGSIAEEELHQFETGVNAESHQWILNQQPPSSGVDVAKAREALNEYTNALSIQNVLGQELPISRYQTELEVTDPPQEKTIGISELFRVRRLRQGMEDQPRRILIRGRPGAGKTTLCRQMLHDFEQTLGDQFRWVFWVPLRRFDQERDLATFLGKVYFKEDYKLANGVCQRNFNQDKDYTLFILDGWDEIRCASPDVLQRVFELANFKNVIITSRSFSVDMSRIYLILDATGLGHDAVVRYISDPDIVSSATTANEIQPFLRKNPPIWQMVQMPFLLYLICSCWDRLKLRLRRREQAGQSSHNHHAISSNGGGALVQGPFCLCQPPCSREEVSLLSDHYLFDQAHPESDCLGKIAIQLFDQRALAMDREDIDQIVEADEQRGKHKWLAPNVTRTSFLHLDGFSEHQHPVYTFVH